MPSLRKLAAAMGTLMWLITAGPASLGADETSRAKPVGDFIRQATYTLEGYLSVFPQTFPSTPGRIVDDKALIVSTKGTVKSQLNLWQDLFARLAFYSAWSSYDDQYRDVFASPDSEEPDARYADFKELSLRYARPAYALIIGKAPLPVSLSTLYSPANRYRVVDTTNPMHPEDLGAWQAGAERSFGNHTVKLTLLPWETRAPLPHGSSRWVGEATGTVNVFSISGEGFASGGLALTVPEGVQARTVFRNQPGYLAKLSGVVKSVDYFAAFHYGPGAFPVLKNAVVSEFTIETPEALSWSAGLATTRGAWEFHGEGLYQCTSGDEDDDFVKYVIGTTYRETTMAQRLGLDEISPVLEYAGEWVPDEQDSPGLSSDSSRIRPFRNSLLFRVDVLVTDKLTLATGGARNFSSDDYAQVFGVEYKPNYNVTFKAAAVVFGGLGDTPFGTWDRNDHFEVGVTRTF